MLSIHPKRSFSVAMMAIVLLCAAAVPGGPRIAQAEAAGGGLLAPKSECPRQHKASMSRKALTNVMTCLHRYARSQAGRDLERLPKLNRTAGAKARDLMRCQAFSHAACGRDPFYWSRRLGVTKRCNRVSENLALGFASGRPPRKMMQRWLRSKGHRKVLMKPGNRFVGVGVVSGRFQGWSKANTWAVHFASGC